MTFTVTAITRCPGQSHWHFTATVNGVARTFELGRDDLDLEPEEVREAALYRLRSAIREAGATNYQQARTAILNKEFKV